jgi:hypothetical protein
MSAKDTLSRITELLGMKPSEQVKMSETKQEGAAIQAEEKVELAQAKLENGTVLEAEAFEAGNEIFIVSEEDRVPVPVGEYEMEDGRILVVEEEGIIAEVKAEEEGQPEAEVEVEVEAAKEEMEYATKEEMSEVKAMIEDLATKIEEMGKKKEEMASQKEEEVPSFKHSPEREEAKKVAFRMESKRPASIMDRVIENLNK